jgi:co-chaperonin GroES (HSP10)
MKSTSEAEVRIMTARNELPGALDPRRIGLLSWTELTFSPTQDHVVLKLDPPVETESGVIIPVSSRRKETTVPATVVAVGPGAFDKRGRRIAMNVAAGDRVLVGGDCGWEIGPHRVIRQGAIEGVLE